MAQQSLTLAEVVDTKDFVTCPQCSQLYIRPLLLPCLHSLCQDCVVDVILTHALDSSSSDQQVDLPLYSQRRGPSQPFGQQKILPSNGQRISPNKPLAILSSNEGEASPIASPRSARTFKGKDEDQDNPKLLQNSTVSRQQKDIDGLAQNLYNMLTTSTHDIQLNMICPVCKACLTLTGSRTLLKTAASDSLDISETSDNDNDNRDNNNKWEEGNKKRCQNARDRKCKGNVIDGLESDGKIDKSPVIKRLRILIRRVVEASLSVNHFLESVTELHRYKSEIVRECQYCGSEGERVNATSLCLECHDDLCESCAKAHRKTRLTRDHTVAPFSSIRQGLFDHDIRRQASIPCSDHLANRVSHFCQDCLEAVCKLCLSRDHYDHNVTSLKEATPKLLGEIKQIQAAVSRRVPALKDYTHFLEGQISKLEKKKCLITEEINAQADLIHKMIEGYRQLSISRMEDTCQLEMTNLQRKIQDLTIAAWSLDDTSKFLLHLSNVGRQDEVLTVYRSVLERHKQLIQSQPNMMTTRLASIFSPGPSTEQNVRILVGELDMQQVPLNKEDAPQTRLSISTLMPKVQRPPHVLLTFKAESPADFSTVYPSGLALNRSMLAVVDRENARVKIFDHNGHFLKDFTGEKDNKLLKPFDAVFLKNGAIAVTDSEAGAVRVFDWTGKFLTNFQGEIRHPRGISMNHKGQVIVLDGHLRQLTMHDAKTGAMIKRIRLSYTKKEAEKDNDDAIFRSDVLIDPFYVAVTREDNIIITDMASPNLKITNEDGLVLATSMDYGTREEESLHPSGLCIDKFGQIFVADTNNSRIHIGLPNGQMPSLLVTQGDGISKPVSLAINEEGHLILAQSGGEIRVLQYL